MFAFLTSEPGAYDGVLVLDLFNITNIWTLEKKNFFFFSKHTFLNSGPFVPTS